MIFNFEVAVDTASRHDGHDLQIVSYGMPGEPVWNVAIECQECGTVLHDWTDPRVHEENERTVAAFNSFKKSGGHPTIGDMLGIKEEPVAQAGGSKEAWNARQNLLDAAHLIESACAWAEKDEAVNASLANFRWDVISGSLEETSTELRTAAESIVGSTPQQFEVWQTTEHPCGYSVYMGQRDVCFHEGCWEEGPQILAAQNLQNAARSLLHNFQVEEEGEDRYDLGYDALAKSLNEWVEWWTTYNLGNPERLTEEQRQRISSVVDNGGKFEDFITRELFFIGVDE